MKKFVFGFFVFLALLLLLVVGGWQGVVQLGADPKAHTAEGIAYGARIVGEDFQVYHPTQGWQDTFVAGVNIGLGAPGYFPGDLGIQKNDYLRWFRQISELNANTIRVYTAQAPHFYEALAEFNRFAPRPLYLIQEVYVNEEDVVKYADVYAENEKIKRDFIADAQELTDMLHGNARVAHRPGRAWGTYTADVSDYVIGWILGVEWDPELVLGTNAANPDKTAFQGTYVTTENASPFEVFLAESAEAFIAYETEQYGNQTPVAFCNWVTTDPLRHPNEPHEVEDAVSVDVEHIRATDRFAPGFFASYHIYPYYPESLNYQADYVATGNPYRAYLDELNAYHTMPVLVAEVGIPTSRGRTHSQVTHGYHQGHISETEQGEILDTLLRDIQDADYMGALLFSWQDEWFKYTWNTMELDAADRRAYWPDYQTSEQNFGLLAFDPGEKNTAAVVDGKTEEWQGDVPLLETEDATVYMRSDEGWLYLRVDTQRFGQEPLYIGLDTLPGQGISTYQGQDLGCEAEFVLILDGPENSRLLVDSYYDPTYFQYAGTLLPRQEELERKDGGLFVPVTQVLNRGMSFPGTVVKDVPFTTFDTGRLTYGVADPQAADYNSLADFYAGEGTVELRLPYMLLNICDPSTGLVLGDFYAQNGFVGVPGDGIGVGLQGDSGRYRWEYWENTPTYHERLKTSYYILMDTFLALNPQRAPVSFLRQFLATFRDPWLGVLGLVILLLLALTAYFFLVLLYVHIRGAFRTRRMEGLKRRAEAGEPEVERTLRTGRGLLAVTQLLHLAEPTDLEDIRSLTAQPAYEDFLQGKLAGKDMEQKILAMDLIGSAPLPALAEGIRVLLEQDEGRTVQYHGLLSLSKMGEYGHMVALCAQGGCKRVNLSYRSLLAIFSAYTGDKRELYQALLQSQDGYMVRVCVKQIGREGIRELAPQVMELVDTQDFSLQLDAVRALGRLKWRPAGPLVLPLLHHPRWELRGVAVTALARIDTLGYLSQLEQALEDPEWQVRFNAAQALSALPDRREILGRVLDCGDRYAAEILTYMVEQAEGKEVAAHA